MEIWEIAPYLMIKEKRCAEDEWRNIYWGGQMVQAFGVEATGKRPSEYCSPEEATELNNLYDWIINQEPPIRSRATVVTSNKTIVQIEGVYFIYQFGAQGNNRQ